ncbi:universal stress protein [Nocardia sp. SSK8]|uniref:universal stress protein n=1 Tax=Nocardia sp. SSK8 TaxID=3120154 RepID=UPI0030090628
MSTPHTGNQPIVVGVDGSEQARIALRWGAECATRHRAPLHLVYAIDVPVDYGPGPIYDAERLRRHGDSVVATAAAEATQHTDVEISTAAVSGSPVAVLRDRSATARLLVIGSRGLGALRRTLLGSVSTSLARHAACPVAVIPESEPAPDAAVVVGVDGSACSAEAIALAFDEAARRGARLVAVHAWTEFFHYDSRATMQTQAESLVAESLAGYAEKYPDVTVERLVTQDRPARAVLAAGADAQLIVVGSRGRGGFTGMTLGSVAQAVLHGADRPVIVVRSGPR